MNRLRNFVLLILLISGLMVLAAGAREGSLPDDPADAFAVNAVNHSKAIPALSPVNPEFLAYRDHATSRKGVIPARESTAIVFRNGSSTRVFLEGEIPSPLDFSYTKGAGAGMKTARAPEGMSYPNIYDLRTSGRVTPVRNQGSAGSCWAFATYGSLESSLLTGETWDFSENNMKNTLAQNYPAGFDRAWYDGGNRFMSAAYLARWSGPVPESADPYSDLSGYSPAGLHTVKHILNVTFLPERAGFTDNDNIKGALMSSGAVQASIYYDPSFYNAAGSSFYNPSVTTTNHAITIVGWNDIYSRGNFNPVPPGDGAFIVKNSWGSGWGDNGYFYVSYYDLTIGDRCAVFSGQPATEYDRVYSYDPLGWVNSLGYDGSTTASFANIFSARSVETLNAIGMYETYPGSFTAEIYLDPVNGPVNSSGPVATVSWSDPLLGYRTVAIPPVLLKKGQKYSVVVHASTPGDSYPVPIESPEPYYSIHATAKAGQGYVSNTGTDWTDMTAIYPNTSICVKAYTTLRSNVGVFRPATRTFRLNNGSVNQTVFGIPTDIPVTGDWNGDGLWDIGIFRNQTHQFVLKNGTTKTVINFGQTTDLPVTGDWNGDGMWDVGVFRPETNEFLLKNGTKITTVRFGYKTDIPVTGDWNGDGLWDVGFYRNTTRTFWLKTGEQYTSITYGIRTDIPVTGDWNGDGMWEVGVFRPSIHRFLLKSTVRNITLNWTQAGDKPVTGKWS